MQNQRDNFDLIIIGAGPGGYAAAIRASQLGMGVALVESGEVGGTCLNRGCIPTKTLLHAAGFFRELEHCGRFGVSVEGAAIDAERLYARKDEVVSQLRQGVETLLAANKVALFRGRGEITGEGAVSVRGEGGEVAHGKGAASVSGKGGEGVSVAGAMSVHGEGAVSVHGEGVASAGGEGAVSVNGEGVASVRGEGAVSVCGEGVASEGDVTTGEGGEVALTAKNILIATGGAPARLPIPGADLPGVVTSDELLAGLDALPRAMVIVGGGVIGVEFATVFSAFGCAVTIIEAAERILPVFDREISQNTAMILKKRGVAVHTSASVEKIERTGTRLACAFAAKGNAQTAEAELVLVSTGRRANISGLFAGGAGVDFDRGIVVDEHFRTSMPGVYAVGDVISGGVQLAHAASAQGCAAVAHMAGERGECDLRTIPSCVYFDPEIACVGLTEQQAKEREIAVKTGKFLMSANGKTLIEAGERGFVKLVFDAESECLLGAQLMCARATDVIGELAAAVVNRLTARQLAAVVRPHPTFCEAVTEAAEDAFGRAIHISPKKS